MTIFWWGRDKGKNLTYLTQIRLMLCAANLGWRTLIAVVTAITDMRTVCSPDMGAPHGNELWLIPETVSLAVDVNHVSLVALGTRERLYSQHLFLLSCQFV